MALLKVQCSNCGADTGIRFVADYLAPMLLKHWLCQCGQRVFEKIAIDLDTAAVMDEPLGSQDIERLMNAQD